MHRDKESTKSEIRNPKQIPMNEIQMIKTLTPRRMIRFEFSVLVIRACFGFRYSDFGF